MTIQRQNRIIFEIVQSSMNLYNGNVVKIDGVRFGGCDLWYNRQFVLHHLNPYFEYELDHVQSQWSTDGCKSTWIP
jgi:hypothetical protein